jgi:hypothetical protein
MSDECCRLDPRAEPFMETAFRSGPRLLRQETKQPRAPGARGEGGDLFSASATSLGRVAPWQNLLGHHPHETSEPDFRRRLSWQAPRPVRQTRRASNSTNRWLRSRKVPLPVPAGGGLARRSFQHFYAGTLPRVQKIARPKGERITAHCTLGACESGAVLAGRQRLAGASARKGPWYGVCKRYPARACRCNMRPPGVMP